MRARSAAALLFLLFFVTSTQALPAGQDEPINGIELPRIGFPAFTTPGGTLKVVLLGEVGPDVQARLENEFTVVDLEALSVEPGPDPGETTVVFRLLGGEAGLYDLVVSAGGAERCEPNSVAVMEDLNPPFMVFWISDTHYDNRPGQQPQEAQFQRHLWLINFLSPDFVLVTGDVCNNPHEVIFQGVYKEMQEFDVPVILIPGNHDHAVSRQPFVKYLALSNVSLDVGPVHIVSLDTGPGSLSGALSPEQLSWLEQDLSATNATVKIVALHHPPFALENRSDANVQMLVDILLRHNVSLVASGHMHENYVFYEPLLMVTNPNSYGIIEQAVEKALPGYRIFWITESGELRWLGGVERPIVLDTFEVEHYQVNDGSALGFSSKIVNKSPWPLNGTLKVRLKPGDVKVDGGKLLAVRESRFGYQVAYVSVVVDPQSERLVKVWVAEDSEPPRAEISAETTVRATSVVIRLNCTVRDDVLGVADIKLSISPDNATWSEVKLLRLDEDTFLGTAKLAPESGKGYIRLETTDVEGRRSSSYFTILWAEEAERERAEVPVPTWVILAVVAGAVLAVLAIKLRR